MQTQVKVSFQGTRPSEALRRTIVEHVETLEKFHGRMTSCHVVVQAPDRHHRSGGAFEVSVHLVMPGGIEVNVDRTPSLDGRFADPVFAVTDAFRRARRQVQDKARRKRGDVKNRRPQPARRASRRPVDSSED